MRGKWGGSAPPAWEARFLVVPALLLTHCRQRARRNPRGARKKMALILLGRELLKSSRR